LRLLVKTVVWQRIAALALLLGTAAVHAGVLAEDRADVMYHRYQGGGITVQGPSVLVRKKFGESFAATANYYVDNISSASIDVVVSGASRYAERREQKSLAVEYLRGKTTYSASFVNSEENDYKADTYSLSVSQDMFGDLTTVSMGYSYGKDHIGSSVDPTFADGIERRNYRVGLTQVLTRNLLASLNFEAVTEQGYLQNPYRFIRFVNGPGSYALGQEVAPRTRTSNAGSVRLKYYLPWRAALDGQYRFYTDTWGINAHTAGLEYTQPLWNRWVFTGSYRYYTQNGTNFFMDLFPRPGYQNFMTRDKENSPLQTHTIGLGAAYEFPLGFASSFIKRGTANLHVNHLMVNYSQFRNLTNFPPGTAEPGTEPLYSLSANVIQFFVSFWY
jgi:hypothetical protein